jgi:hypothetical protein
VFVLGKPFQPSLIFVGEATLVLSPCMKDTEKSFITFAPEGLPVDLTETDRLGFSDGSRCQMEIRPVEESDAGVWECFPGSGIQSFFKLSIALEPESVLIETVEETSEVRCVVKKAKPRPQISWFVDDVIIEEKYTKFFEGNKLVCAHAR